MFGNAKGVVVAAAIRGKLGYLGSSSPSNLQRPKHSLYLII